MSKTTVLMMMFAGVMAVVPSSYAVPITFEYEGVVTNVNDDGSYLDGSIVVGTTFSGTYTFESTTPDDYPDVPWARYTFPASPELVITLLIGSYDLVAPLASIVVENADKDSYGFRSHPFLLGSKEAFFVFGCMDLTHSAFDTDALSTDPPDITRFQYAGFSFESTDQFGDSFTVGGTLTSITPEPQSVVFLMIGVLAACAGKKH